MLFHRTHPARYASWSFLVLLVLFAGMLNAKPAVGFAGIGAVLILASLLILVNHQRIWDTYRKTKPNRFWNKPSKAYYTFNVYVVWPLVFLLGLGAIATAYYLA